MTLFLTAALLALSATPAPALSFPRDHGAHSDAALEWWYYTGHLRDQKAREYGFELTFFRAGDYQFAHFAWTDVEQKTFWVEEKSHLSLPGVAEASAERLQVSIENWSAEESAGDVVLKARGKDWQFDLQLKPQTPPIANGPGGISRKGPGPNEYSHYVSIPRLRASGTFRTGSASRIVSGTVWFDHEWGPGALPHDVAGWDWFGIQLSDGSELMLYRMRTPDGGATPFSVGTFVSADGRPTAIRWSDVTLSELSHWKSSRSGTTYPSRWKIAVASLGLDVEVDALVADQELITSRSTNVLYWEGTCRVSGTKRASPIDGRAYAELTGYGRFGLPGFKRS